MANKKTRYKTITHIPGQIRFTLPDGNIMPFENATKAQQWFNKNYGNGYSMVEYTPTQGDSKHPIQLQEITVTAQAPKFKSTPSAKTGVDMYIGRNYDPEFNKHYYGMSHLDALLGKVRVENMRKADPQVIKNFRDGSNAAAAFFAAPLVAYGAGEYVLPWIAQNVAPYLSARGWLAATQAAGNTPAWLTPTSATAIDAALAGGTTGVSVSDMIQNGPTVGNVLGTTAGVVGLGAEAAPTIMEGVQAGQKAYNTFKLSKELNKAAKQFDGTVGASYFKSPSNWYRVTESPEIMDIRFRGKNVTTRDIGSYDSPSDNFRNFVIKNQLKPGSGENEGYWIMPRKKRLLDLAKQGSAHGNTSQAAKGEIWGGTFAASRKFPSYIIEGEGPTKVFRGFNPVTGVDSRTNFVKVPWEEVPLGARIGFHTGEMPIEGLRAFRRLPNGRYQYEGPILPDKTIRVQTSPSKSIYDDYDFEQYSKNLSITPAKINNEAQRYYDRVVQPLLKTDRPLFHEYNKKAIILDEVPGEPEYVDGIHFSDNGENIVTRKGKDMINTGIHEVVSHGTDDILPYEAVQEYDDLVYKLLNTYQGPVTEGSGSSKEFRATMNEIRKQLQKYWLKKGNVDLNGLDKVSDAELLKLMRDTNGYGATYQRAYKQLSEQEKSEWMLQFRKALKTLPIAGGIFAGLQNNEKN